MADMAALHLRLIFTYELLVINCVLQQRIEFH